MNRRRYMTKAPLIWHPHPCLTAGLAELITSGLVVLHWLRDCRRPARCAVFWRRSGFRSRGTLSLL